MRHLFIFFYLITLMTGAASLAVSCFIYARTRYRLLRYYIAYMVSFTLFVFSFLFVVTYADLNLARVGFNLLLSIVSVSFLSFLFLMISIPLLNHALVLEGSSGRRNAVVIVVSVVAFLLMASTMRINFAEERIQQVRDARWYLSLTLFYSIIVYSILLKLFSLKRLDGERMRMTRTLMVLNIVFFPGILYDLYLYNTHRVFAFTPVFYSIFAVIFTVYIARRYIVQLRSISSQVAGLSFDTALSRAGISEREREIVYLVLEGRGNRDIAERLFISPNTVKTHIRNIFKKMDVKSRFELAMKLKSGEPG